MSAPPPAMPKLSGPYAHANLTLFLIHGPDAVTGRTVVTLKEAMEQKLVTVHETSTVNLLSIENTSTEVEVFVMTGDVVKGGKQDRVIAYDMILPAKSGPVPLPSFCVESGRWQKRGAETEAMFSVSANQVVGKGLRAAVNESRQQGEVWKEVAAAQKKLSESVSKNVQNDASPSSLQLCLEDKELQAKVAEYEKALADVCRDKADVIGIAVVVNGTASGADVFGSNDLFRKLWPKLLKAAATEALAEFKADKKFEPMAAEAVAAFLADAGQGEGKEVTLASPSGAQRNQSPVNTQRAFRNEDPSSQTLPPANVQPGGAAPRATHYRLRVLQYANAKSLLVESRDKDKPGVVFHRCYIAK